MAARFFKGNRFAHGGVRRNVERQSGVSIGAASPLSPSSSEILLSVSCGPGKMKGLVHSVAVIEGGQQENE